MLLPQTSELTRNIEKECLTVSQLLLASGRINFFFFSVQRVTEKQ